MSTYYRTANHQLCDEVYHEYLYTDCPECGTTIIPKLRLISGGAEVFCDDCDALIDAVSVGRDGL